MSDRMSVEHAGIVISGYGAYTVNEVRAAHTIVAQAEQIKRLQEAVEHALYYSTEFTSDLIQEGIILPDDMEPPA